MKHRIDTLGYHVVNGHPHVTVIREHGLIAGIPIRTYRVHPATAERVVEMAVSLRQEPGYGVMLGTLGWTLYRH